MEVGLDVEDGLVELMVADLGAFADGAGSEADQAGAGYSSRLPLLAHALWATWQQRSGSTLTVASYAVTGGVQRAIATTADRLFDALPPPSREMARWVFLRLVIVGRDADDTCRRVAYGDLLREAPDPELAAMAVDAFTD